MNERQRVAAAAAAGVLALAGLRYAYALPLNAVPDEADNFVWSQRLALGYFDQPPLLMWVLAGAERVLGSRILAVRLVPALLSLGTFAYLFRLGRAMVGDRVTCLWLALMALTPLFTLGAMLATPDAPMIFCLSGASYHGWLAITRGRPGSWMCAGLLTGLALLSKYTGVLVLASLFLYLWLTDRATLKRREPWLAVLLSVLVFSPVVAWNASHDWVSFGFQWRHGFGTQEFPQWRSVPEYVALQAAVVGPIALAMLVAALAVVPAAWVRHGDHRRFLWCLAVVPLAFFLCSSLFRKVEANWPCFAYVPGLLLVADLYETRWRQALIWRVLWRSHWAYSALVLAVLLVHIYVPFLPLRRDRANEFFGWDALGVAAAGLAREHPGLGLAANRYQLASELAFYSYLPVTCLNIGSRPNQYDLWQDQDRLRGQTFLFFGEGPIEKSGLARRTARARHVTTLEVRGRGNRTVRQVFVYEVTLPR